MYNDIMHVCIGVPSSTSNTTSVQMNNSDIHRLLMYDQTNDTDLRPSYFADIPTTLRYPSAQQANLEAYIETIERAFITPLDLLTWQQLQLFLIEPEWLQTGTRRTLRRKFYDALSKNTHFVNNIIDQYSNVTLFVESSEKQEFLFFTICALVNISEKVSAVQHDILQYKNTILLQIKDNPYKWEAFIKGSDWLLEELQTDEGSLNSFLEQVSLIKPPIQHPESMIRQAMSMWVEQAETSTLQEMDRNLNRVNDMLKGIVSNVTAKNQPTQN